MNCDELQKNAKASCYLVKRPKALQWFHYGRLCKATEEERQAGRFELFLDLLCKIQKSRKVAPLDLTKIFRRCYCRQLQRGAH